MPPPRHRSSQPSQVVVIPFSDIDAATDAATSPSDAKHKFPAKPEKPARIKSCLTVLSFLCPLPQYSSRPSVASVEASKLSTATGISSHTSLFRFKIVDDVTEPEIGNGLE
ncbi:hypothetical protein NL676_021245 [Syzygium grande]|nr:hypothetical protein NL676_021245 [Syzygium grande]